MLNTTNKREYLLQLQRLAASAKDFTWKNDAAHDCEELAYELKRLLESWDNVSMWSRMYEVLCRYALAEYSPSNGAYYLSPEGSSSSDIKRQMWLLYSMLKLAEHNNQPKVVIEAALTVCTSTQVACSKILELMVRPDVKKQRLPGVTVQIERPHLRLVGSADDPSPSR